MGNTTPIYADNVFTPWSTGKAGKPLTKTGKRAWLLPERWDAKRFMQCDACDWRGECDAELIGCADCGSLDVHDARRRVLYASQIDWLDQEVPIECLLDLLDLLRRTPNLDWVLLTNRIENWRPRLQAAMDSLAFNRDPKATLSAWIANWLYTKPPHNVCIGTPIVNQEDANRNMPILLAVPARIRFVRISRMEDFVDLASPYTKSLFDRAAAEDGLDLPEAQMDPDTGFYEVAGEELLPGLHWIICGGESGHKARPLHPDWVRNLRNQSVAAGVPFLFEGWGEWVPIDGPNWPSAASDRLPNDCFIKPSGEVIRWDKRGLMTSWTDYLMRRVGHKNAGRQLDGHIHDGFPRGAT